MLSAVLASDAEREACVSRLRDAAAEGRLGVAELEGRVDAAYRARTRDDLAELLADLPGPLRARSRTPGLRWPGSAACRCVVAFGTAAHVTLLALWLADAGAMRHVVVLGITEFDLPWPVIPLAAWCGAIGAAAAWRRRRTEPTTQTRRSLSADDLTIARPTAS